MGKMNVAQFAGELGLPVELLLEQLQAAGVARQQESDSISEQDKAQLLEHLHSTHGSGSANNKKITLTRRETSEIKKSDSTGRARTIQVEVRKKRVVAPITAVHIEQPVADVVKVAPAQTLSKTSRADILGEQEIALRNEEARNQAELASRQAAEVQAKKEHAKRKGGASCRACGAAHSRARNQGGFDSRSRGNLCC